jgi:mono/diheme cytochrome c family protein
MQSIETRQPSFMDALKQTSIRLLLTAALAVVVAARAADKPAAVAPEHARQMAAGLALFQESVGPLLRQHCVKCHGDGKTRGGLDLATREALLKGGDDGTVVVPGRSQDSLLYKLVAHLEKPHMPSKEPKLPDAAIAQIARWIDLGAPYDQPLVDPSARPSEMQVTDDDRQFWSFAPLRQVRPPRVRNERWVANDIDRFILAKLEAQGLQPSAPADPRALIRRLHFDLTGLPPTPEEVEAFVRECGSRGSDSAFRIPHSAISTLADRLLASPHFGERWSRHWLDVARFAESHGFEQDYDRPYAYHYRDFVIRAFNADMPYDRFVRWQLAGDEFAPDDPLAMMATGFLGAGVFPTQLTEKEFESARYDELDDMAHTTGTAFLGLTVGCARCHDHKFDPIPVKDYYRLVSTFTTTIRSEIDLDLDPEGTAAKLAKWEREHQPLAGALAKFEKQVLPGRFAAWAERATADAARRFDWIVLRDAEAKSAEGAEFKPQDDGSLLVTGKNPKHDQWVVRVKSPATGLTALRIEALADDSLKKKGPGRADNGNFALSDLRVYVESADGTGRHRVSLVSPRATFQQNDRNLAVAAAIDDDPRSSGWAVDPQLGTNHAAVFEFERPVSVAGESVLVIELDFFTNAKHAIGRPRFAVTTGPGPVPLEDGAAPAEFAALLGELKQAGSLKKLEPARRQRLLAFYRPLDEQWSSLNAAVAAHLAAKPRPHIAKVQVTSEGFPPTKHHADDRGFPHFYPQTHFLKRGDPNQKDGVATQGFLQVLMRKDRDAGDWQVEPPDDWRTSYRRRSLANWITDTESGAGHLLARVIVNRVWQHHLGRGIVNTPNDFGLQGELPTHPELLDWLASELIRSGWRLKELHKLIVTSATYRQASAWSEAAAKADPENRWYWRRDPQRLEAEVIRDSLLAVSGLLDPAMFGPGTLDETMKRRSIYFMIKRSELIPSMTLFDSPEPLVSQGSRPATIIAPQALMFMNSPQVRECAVALAAKLDTGAGNEAVVRRGYAMTVSRPPTDAERRASAAFIEKQEQSYRQDGRADARRLALADFAQVLFGLNEFIYLN